MHLREWVTNLQSSWQSRIKKYVTAFLNSMPTSWEVTLTHFMVHLSY